MLSIEAATLGVVLADGKGVEGALERHQRRDGCKSTDTTPEGPIPPCKLPQRDHPSPAPAWTFVNSYRFGLDVLVIYVFQDVNRESCSCGVRGSFSSTGNSSGRLIPIPIVERAKWRFLSPP